MRSFRQRMRVPLAGLLLAMLVGVNAGTAAVPTTDEEEGPTFCPIDIPAWGSLSSLTGITFPVRKWQQPDGAEVPFRPTSFRITTQIQPVLLGWGWYEIFPKETQHEGRTWRWEASSGKPGVLARCNRHFSLILGWITTVTWAGQIWGHAFPADFEPPPPTTQVRPGGGQTITGWQCWELVEVGFLPNGEPYELILDSWCNPVFAE